METAANTRCPYRVEVVRKAPVLEEGLAAHQLVGEVMAHQGKTGRGCESMTPHNGTEIRPILLRKAAAGNLAQWTKV